jgi:hypothetical protein
VSHTARYLLAALGLALAVFLAGCGDDDGGYPAEVKENFLSSCTGNGGTDDACSCVWEKVTAEYSYEEFVKIEDDLAAGRGGEEIIPLIQECITAGVRPPQEQHRRLAASRPAVSPGCRGSPALS